MRRAARTAWWIVEVGVPALAVLGGVTLLLAAAVAQVSGALKRPEQVRLFLYGVGFWAGGIAWGALVNNGVPGLRDP